MGSLLKEICRNLKNNIRNGEPCSFEDLWFDEDEEVIIVQYRDNEYKLVIEKN